MGRVHTRIDTRFHLPFRDHRKKVRTSARRRTAGRFKAPIGLGSCWRLLSVRMGRPHTVSQHEDGSSSHCFWQREWVVPAACCAHIIPVTRLGRPQDNARGLPNLAVSAASWRQTQRPSAIWSIITNVTVSYLLGFHLLAIFSPTDVRPP